MSGHVFHPGHHALHGITVVLETRGSHTYVGRFDNRDEQGVHLLDVAVHDATSGETPKDEYLQRTMKFGVRAQHKHVLVPAGEVASVTPLSALP